MKNKFKVFISLLISLIISFQAVFPVFAKTNSDADLETSIEYSVDEKSSGDEAVFEEIEALDDEIKALDELAQYYYDYYEEHGEFPPENEISLQSVSASTVVSLLGSAGITTTANKIAEFAATVGLIGSLDGPMPVLDVLAIMLGIYFVATSDYDYSFSELKRLNNNSDEIKAEAGAAVSTKKATVRTNVAKALASAYAVALSKRNNNAEYFNCIRNDGPGGGVTVQDPITYSEALSRVVVDHDDVYCITSTAALKLANAASTAIPGSKVKRDPAHNLSTQPLNLPHYHIEINGSHATTKSHIFYPI